MVKGIPCGRRVAKLHLSGRYFLCRHCHRLGYASQSEAPWARALRRANKIRQQLGNGEAAILETIGDYVLWQAGVTHRWYVEREETVVLTVRWPSLPQ